MNVHQISLFSVDQCVSLIFHQSYSCLMIFCASMSDIEFIKRGVFIQFGMENLMVHFFKWTLMHVHQLSSFQYWSLIFKIFHESYSYLMLFCANMSCIKIMKRSVFIQFWLGEMCFKWAPIHIHQLSSFQCWPECFLDFP